MSRDEAKGRGALLSDICKGAKLKKTSGINDRSAPILESRFLVVAEVQKESKIFIRKSTFMCL